MDGYPQLVPCSYALSEFKQITARWQIGMQEKGGWNSIYLEVGTAWRTQLTVEPRCRPLSLEVRRYIDAGEPLPHGQAAEPYAVYPDRDVVRLSRGGNRHGQLAQGMADRGVQRYRESDILLRVSIVIQLHAHG